MEITKFKLTQDLIDNNSGKIIHEDTTTDNADGINMSGSGNHIKWIVKVGTAGVGDWCLYTHFTIADAVWISKFGDKISSKENIKKLIDCDDAVLKNYRY